MTASGDAGESGADAPGVVLASAERLKAFTDAVVAIAMTLLILPLMESVGEKAHEGADAAEWVVAEVPQLFTFVLSFVLIANFWMTHHRVFDRVESVSGPLMWLTLGWMLSIVWLPVATAIIGQIPPDAVGKILYIGSMIFTALFSLFSRLYLLRHPGMHAIPADRLRRGVVADGVMSLLFAAALIISIAVPALTYWPLLILFLQWPLWRAATRLLLPR